MAARLKTEMAEQTQQWVQQQLAQMMAQRTELIAQESTRAIQTSCQSVQLQPYFDPIQQLERPCKLLVVRDGVKHEVAIRKINLPVKKGIVIHDTLVPDDHARVTVDACHPDEDDTMLPVPNGELVTLCSVIGSYITWSMALISIEDQEQPKEPVGFRPFLISTYKDFDTINFNQLGGMYMTVRDRFLRQGQPFINVPAPHELFNEPYVISVNRDDYRDLCKCTEWLTIPLMQIFMLDNFPEIPIGFMNPDKKFGYLFQGDDHSKEYVDTYLRKALRENRDKKFIFIPYFQDAHWVLFVLRPYESELYLFDSSSTKYEKHKLVRDLAIIDALRDPWVVEKATGGIVRSNKLKLIKNKD